MRGGVRPCVIRHTTRVSWWKGNKGSDGEWRKRWVARGVLESRAGALRAWRSRCVVAHNLVSLVILPISRSLACPSAFGCSDSCVSTEQPPRNVALQQSTWSQHCACSTVLSSEETRCYYARRPLELSDDTAMTARLPGDVLNQRSH